MEEPAARAHRYFHTLEHAEAGEFETVSLPIQMEGHDLTPRRAAAPLGADTRAVLAEAGLSEREIDEAV